jgi:hypothetical protein
MCPRIPVPGAFAIALVSLLLCAIVASELPELLTLTDNTANDFTLRRADSFVSAVLHSAENLQKAAIEFNNSTQDSLFGRLGTPERRNSLLHPFHPVLRPAHIALLSLLPTISANRPLSSMGGKQPMLGLGFGRWHPEEGSGEVEDAGGLQP